MIFHNSQAEKYRRPFGAAVAGSTVRLYVDAKDCDSCFLMIWTDGTEPEYMPMEPCEGGFCISVTMPDEPKPVWYCFTASGRYFGNNPQLRGGCGTDYDYIPPGFQITVYKPSKTPDWYKNAIVYQIFPDRFNRGSDWIMRQQNAAECRGKNSVKRMLHENWDDTPFYPKDENGNVTRWPFFGGTLEGIREKLGYLRELGVTAIYLNPIFKAASNHKYDTCDYLTVDEGFGDEDSFRRLAESAKDMGISLILDGVFSHTGADSLYFDKYHNYHGGACEGESSPYYSWYRFQQFPNKYECWWGVSDLPNVEENDSSYREFICRGKDSVIRKWLNAGAKGWRLDVADELPDSFIKDVRKAMDETDGDSVLLGEVWEDASNKISYGERREYLYGDELHSTMNYPFRSAAIDYIMGRLSPDELGATIMSLMENYPPENFYGSLNLIGSHDRARTLTVLGGAPGNLTDQEKSRYRLSEDAYDLAVRRMKLISLLQFVTPGVPCIYYGDEAGAEGYEDPYNRGTYPWGNENQELLRHYMALGKLRSELPALVSGDYAPLVHNSVYGCIRTLDDMKVLALFNRDDDTKTVQLPDGFDSIIFSTENASVSNNQLILPPFCGAVLTVDTQY